MFWSWFYDQWNSLNGDQIKMVLAICSGISFVYAGIMFVMTRWMIRRDRDNHIDRDSVFIEFIDQETLPNGLPRIGVDTDGRVYSLTKLLGSPRIANIARKNIRSCHSGARVLEGADHHTAMQRISVWVEGDDRTAIISRLAGRSSQYNVDEVCFCFTCGSGEDGNKTGRVLVANPDFLVRFLDEEYVANMRKTIRRFAHNEYIDLAVKMAHALKESDQQFLHVDSRAAEIKAGERAFVWRTRVTTMKTTGEVVIRTHPNVKVVSSH